MCAHQQRRRVCIIPWPSVPPAEPSQVTSSLLEIGPKICEALYLRGRFIISELVWALFCCLRSSHGWLPESPECGGGPLGNPDDPPWVWLNLLKKEMRKFNIYVFSFFSEFSKNYQYLIYYLYYDWLLPPSYSKINFLFVYLHFIYNNCNSIAIITILWPLLQYHCKYLPSIINVCGTIGREMATLIGQTHFFADNIVTLGDQTISGLVF